MNDLSYIVRKCESGYFRNIIPVVPVEYTRFYLHRGPGVHRNT